MTTKKEFEKNIYLLTNKLQVGLFDEVIPGVKKLLKVSKDQVLFNILSLAYQGKGDYDKSIELLKKAIKSDQKNIFFLNNIGLSYFKKGDLKNAEYYLKKAIEINPKYINSLNNYANLKKELNQFDEAIEYFEKAYNFKNDSFEINFNLGTVHQGLGNYKNAVDYFEKASSINPNFTKVDRNISSMISYTEDNQHFLSMKKKILNADLADQQRLELHFALGKAYEDIKDYKNAFENIKKANSLMKAFTKYKIDKDEKLFKSIKDFFTEKKFTRANHNNIKTIFILGMPRSGTSLVEQILSSSQKVLGGGELVHMSQIVRGKFIDTKVDMDNLKKVFDEAQKDYISRISLHNDNLLTFTDKSPLNFQWIGYIINMLPNSKIIHCKRDKLDVCWSNYKNQFEGNLYFSNNFSDLGKFYKLYEDLMKFWEKKFEKQIYNLNYEKLVENPEKIIRDMIDFCEIDWDENFLKHHKNKRPIKTVSFNQARKPIYKDKIKNSLLYDEYLGELKKCLN